MTQPGSQPGNEPDHEAGPGQGEPRDTAVPPGHPAGTPADGMPDISGVSNWVEEGGPLEPGDELSVDAAPEETAPADDLARQLSERTADLQRLQAEYVNYKRRVDRDRELVRENAVYTALGALLPVLDDIDRAREHGELEGGFKAVADSLERAVGQLGLTRFGAQGEEFDPNLHEALMHGQSADVDTTVVDHVAQAGYRMGERVVRAAKVTVLGPAE